MDTIFLHNLIYRGFHGAHREEKKKSQRFGVEIDLAVDISKSGASDQLPDTVDYQHIRDIAKNRIENGPAANLIEKLAQDIAQEILQDQRIQSVTVTIRKLDVWANGISGVSITRDN